MYKYKPGRELDALIAEHVMGFAREGNSWRQEKIGSGTLVTELPAYSHNIAAAWEVVEKVGLLKSFTLEQRNHRWEVWDRNEVAGDDLVAEGESAPHAICLAALKAVRD